MTVHISKTLKLFKESRTEQLFKLKQMHVSLIMDRYGLDEELYERMRKLTSELKPFTSDEETDILIEIEQNKRFFWED